jgi:hypothetical protein
MKRPVRLLFGGVLAMTMAMTMTMTMAAAPVAAASFPDTIALPDGWAPEGIAAGHGTTVFVGSLNDGAIWQGNVRTGTGSVLVPGVTGRTAVGVEYDARHNRIWVAGGPTGTVRVYDARTGTLLRTYQFEAGFLNDLVVTRDAVYVTDSMIQQLAVVPLGRAGELPPPGDVTTLPLSGEIAFVPGEFNANGIVASGRVLVLVQTNTGRLFRVDPDSGVADAIDLGGETVTFGDGLELRGRTLYVVRNQLNLVAVFRLDGRLDDGRLVGTMSSPELDVPSTAAFAAGRLWLVNARFGTDVTPTTPYSIVQVPQRS